MSNIMLWYTDVVLKNGIGERDYLFSQAHLVILTGSKKKLQQNSEENQMKQLMAVGSGRIATG